MNYENYWDTPRWTKSFWDPVIAPLSDVLKPRKINQLDPKQLYNNYMTDSSQTYEFDFFETDDSIVNSYWKDKNIKYIFNAHGYRGPSFNSDAKLKIVTIGCSHVFGTSIDESQTWASCLKKAISEKYNISKDIEVFNLGIPGASCDTNVVQLYQLIDIINPDIVFWLPTNYTRYDLGIYSAQLITQFETFEHKNISIEVYEHFTETLRVDVLGKKMLSRGVEVDKRLKNYIEAHLVDSQTNYQNFCKNLAIMRDICEYRNIALYSFVSYTQLNSMYIFLVNKILSQNKSTYKLLGDFINYLDSKSDYLKDSKFDVCFKDLEEDPMINDFLVDRKQKNIISDKLIKTPVINFISELLEGKYNYLAKESHLGMAAYTGRDGIHNGELFSMMLSHICMEIANEDIVKTLNT